MLKKHTGIKSSSNEKVAATYPLDSYSSNLSFAYSLRKLRSAYTGYCIRVKRSSDGTTQDFGFASNVLDTAAVTNFVGGGTGYVVV